MTNVRSFSKIIVIAMALCLVGLKAFAEETKGLKIAIVDNQVLSQEIAMSKDMKKKVSAKESEIQALLVKREEKIKNDLKSLESKRAVLSGDELQKKARNLEMEYQKLQMDQQIYARVFEITRISVLQEVSSNITKATNKVAAGKYDMVVPIDLMMYVDQSKFTNITKEVIAKTNDIAKTVNFDKAFKSAEEQIKKSIESNNKKK